MLIFMDGFDHYATADFTKKWTAVAGSSSINLTAGRRGSGALSTGTGAANYLSKTLGANYATLIVGFGFNTTTNFPATNSKLVEFFDGTTTQADIRVNSDGTLSATRNGTVLGTSTAALTINGFNYVEAKITFNATTGTVDLRLNGTSILSLTGQNTRNGTNAYANTIRLGQYGASAGSSYFDDFYCCDSGGGTNNNFLGDVRIDTLLPNADGTYAQFTPSTGTAHYANVDDAAPNTTDYNDGVNVGDRDSYALTDLAAIASQTIYAVQVNAAINKDDAGAKSAALMVRSGGANSDGGSVVLGTSQIIATRILEANPNGGAAWTESAVNALEAGVVVTA